MSNAKKTTAKKTTAEKSVEVGESPAPEIPLSQEDLLRELAEMKAKIAELESAKSDQDEIATKVTKLETAKDDEDFRRRMASANARVEETKRQLAVGPQVTIRIRPTKGKGERIRIATINGVVFKADRFGGGDKGDINILEVPEEVARIAIRCNSFIDPDQRAPEGTFEFLRPAGEPVLLGLVPDEDRVIRDHRKAKEAEMILGKL